LVERDDQNWDTRRRRLDSSVLRIKRIGLMKVNVTFNQQDPGSDPASRGHHL
jgi:hypothetical protein